jgi:hypothetical protein
MCLIRLPVAFYQSYRGTLTVISDNLSDSDRKELCGLAEEMAGNMALLQS